MRWYWVKIALGALAIFAIGYVGVTAVRGQIHRVRSLAESSDPINIPLALIPFQLDGDRAGTFSGLRIMRDSPKRVSAFHIRVKLGDSVDVERLKTCRLHLEQSGADFDPDDSFTCLEPGALDSGLVEFGEVTFTTGDDQRFTVPLLLSAEAVEELRHSGSAEHAAARAVAESEAAAARVEAERIKIEVKTQIENARNQVRQVKPDPPATRP